MGENLILNFESRGFTVAVYNRTTSKVDAFISGRGSGMCLFYFILFSISVICFFGGWVGVCVV